VVVRATEAYTASLEGQRRQVQPLVNHMIATEPLPDAVWDEIGLARRELFEDSRLMLGYGQRTADGRIAWGGLAAPSWYASRVPPSPMTDRRTPRRLRDRLVERFPVLADVKVTHRWTGVLGVTRDLRPGVGLDRATGLGWIGGYLGAGVAASNAAGRALADLVTGADTDRVRLPWVGHRSRRWEPEPLRWLEVHAATTAAKLADRLDR
jgi:glycine/D-amino acid oxidase-like deaminating enzyme